MHECARCSSPVHPCYDIGERPLCEDCFAAVMSTCNLPVQRRVALRGHYEPERRDIPTPQRSRRRALAG